ncbi:MAG: T9SS type A sorting domain-containing protein [bacterium]|nr:T9SS type A sorting domain-containing protein [bacterium]
MKRLLVLLLAASLPALLLAQPIDTVQVGSTWCDVQHNGTVGRMIAKSSDGFVHLIWMNALDSGQSSRHIFYNYVNPNGIQGWPMTGIQVDNTTRAGYACLDVNSAGIAFPAFHVIDNSYPILHTVMAVDLGPHWGAFLSWPITATVPLDSLIWPQMQIGHNGRLHIVSTQVTAEANQPLCQYYTYGTYNPGNYSITYPNPVWTFMDTTMNVAATVSTSDLSDRVAFVWTRPRHTYGSTEYNTYNNDVYYLIDNDGVSPIFELRYNLTNFLPPDLSYLPDTLRAEMDTLRAYTDVSACFDNSDYLHVAFTTIGYYELENRPPTMNSLIWHWSEQYPAELRLVADGWFGGVSPGSGHHNVQRSSLSGSNGYLYCAYQQYDQDSMHLSSAGLPSGEVYVSVSIDGGLNWSVGTNVTHTITPYHASPGQCFSETDPSLAKQVDDYLHLMYVMDRNAGTGQPMTLNPVYYHRVQTSLIPTTPLMPQDILFHVEPPPPPPRLEVTIVPNQPPWYPYPPLRYDMTIHNISTRPQTFDVWNKFRTPSGTYMPCFGPIHRTLPSGAQPMRTLIQMIPYTLPAGVIYYISYIGTYPTVIVDSSYFTFTNLASSGNKQWTSESDLYDDCFDEYAAETEVGLPDGITLSQNYPNPFNLSTAISYQLQVASLVNLSVYDISGKRVAELVNGILEAGTHSVTFDASGLTSGVYLYKLEAGDFTKTQKMVLLK